MDLRNRKINRTTIAFLETNDLLFYSFIRKKFKILFDFIFLGKSRRIFEDIERFQAFAMKKIKYLLTADTTKIKTPSLCVGIQTEFTTMVAFDSSFCSSFIQ